MNTKFSVIFAAVSLALLHRAGAQVLQNAPGTPVSGYDNPGTPTFEYAEGGGVGVQTITDTSDPGSAPFTALAGDVVFLLDPAAGTGPSNWAAVVRFFNPDDLSGMLGHAADYYETFRTNNTPGGFANLTLMPNTAYVTSPGDLNGGHIVVYQEFGPSGEIQTGQLAEVTLAAFEQPDNGSIYQPPAAPEPGPFGWLAAGAALGGIILHRRRTRVAAGCRDGS